MADSPQEVLNKQFDLRNHCSHSSRTIVYAQGTNGNWELEVCIKCGDSVTITHLCIMVWTDKDTRLVCPNCKADGT